MKLSLSSGYVTETVLMFKSYWIAECVCVSPLPWSGSRPNREFLRPKRMLKVLPAEVVLLGQETCMKLTWQLVGTKSMQPSGWGRTPACLKEGHALFLSSRANWVKKGGNYGEQRTQTWFSESTSCMTDSSDIVVCVYTMILTFATKAKHGNCGRKYDMEIQHIIRLII